MIPLRWSDTDAYGHINNVLFLRLIEEARAHALSDYVESQAEGARTALLVVRSEIEHFDPLLYRLAPVAIDLWVTRFGAADLDMEYQVLDPAPEEGGENVVYAQAQTTLVAFDQASGRPRRITAEEKVWLEEWRDEPLRWRRRRPSPKTPAK